MVDVNGQVEINLSAVDLEGDPFNFAGAFLSNPTNAGGSIAGNVLTIIPDSGFSGIIRILVGVAQAGATGRGSSGDLFDKQSITIAVGDQPIQGEASVIAASRDVRFENVRVATFGDEDSGSVAGDFTALIRWGDGTQTDGVVAPLDGGGFEVRGSHRFERDGEYHPLVDIQGVGGARAKVDSRIDVAPEMSVRSGVAAVILQWPAWTLNYDLERRDDGGAWVPANGTRRIQGYDLTAEYPLDPAVSVFRLRRP